MLVNVQLQLLRHFPGIYDRFHSVRPFGQHGQYRIVYVIVHQHNPSCCLSHQFRHKRVCIIYLPVEEDALFGRKGTLYEEVDLLFVRIQYLPMFL